MAEPLTTASDNTAVVNRINLLSQSVNQAGEDTAFRISLNAVLSFAGGVGHNFREHLQKIRGPTFVPRPGQWGQAELNAGAFTERARHLTVNSPQYNEAATYVDYKKVLSTIFCPESNLARVEFVGYRQSSLEDVGAYFSTKYALSRLHTLSEKQRRTKSYCSQCSKTPWSTAWPSPS